MTGRAVGRPVAVPALLTASGGFMLANPADVGGHAGVLALIGVGFAAAGTLLVLRGRRRRSGPGPGPVGRPRRWWRC